MTSTFCAVLVVSAAVLSSPLDPTRSTRDVELKSWIRYYETADYDPESLRSQLSRVKRDANDPSVRLNIRGHDRWFKLKLFPDRNVFADDVEFESTNGKIPLDPGFAYVGTLEDDETASVHGVVTVDGLFEGTVRTRLDEYHIEPLSRYVGGSDRSSAAHSIVYKSSDVDDPRNRTCRSEALRAKRWLLQAEAKVPHEASHLYLPPIDEELDVGPPNRSAPDLILYRNVNKRALVDPKKTTCMLYLQADHQFFQKYGTEEACIEVMTRHVQRVNAIYRSTDFNQDGKADNITFMVKRIKVHTADALRDPLYRFPNNYGVEKFLELFSEEDYDAFCLAYMFTYRDFEMGTLGLAWTGDLKNAGGVCEKNGHYRGSMKSLNTGIVTLLNYGKQVPPAVSHVTLAHEIGHNFGSPHDPEQCTPGGEDGNFIMFARATSGDKKNNNHFSPCSLKSINPVLNFKARSPKGCFTEPKASLCGNGVVEEGEECDCGWEEDCADRCCHPQRRHAPPDEPPCRLSAGSQCSPSQGPCCSSECRVRFGDKCRDDNGCRDESFCDGRDARCPPSTNKPNKTICNKEFVCFMGECTGSICLAYGLESCQCRPPTGACELCCKRPGDGQPCRSSFEWNQPPYDVPDVFSKPGTPCDDYNGYCDVFQVCREVDPSGPLATLRKMLLSDESIAGFKQWVLRYWYGVAGIVLLLIALLVLSTKYLGKTGRPRFKSVTIIHNSPTEPVNLQPDDPQVIVHQALNSKLPLKRKVRDGKTAKKKNKKSINNNVNSPAKKVAKRKKPAEATVPPKPKKPHQVKKKKRKEIDYSTPAPEVADDPVGKVQNWLMKSQFPKSKSTPVGLAEKARRSPRKRPTIRPRADKSKSVGNIPAEKDKVRLQVVYKPPFKFSVKFHKPEKPVAKRKASLVVAREREAKPRVTVNPIDPVDPIDSNIHTVQSDLEVLLSENEYVFSE